VENQRRKKYCILGISNYELDKSREAETYLKQTVLLDSNDDSFKQTARYYLIQIYAKRTADNATAENRGALGALSKEFLNSHQKTIFNDDYYNSLRALVKNVLLGLEDISGQWVDEQGHLYPMLERNEYRIEPLQAGKFRISMRRVSTSNDFTANFVLIGNLSKDNSKFYGTLTASVVGVGVSGNSSMVTSVTQDGQVELTLSADYSRLTGSVTFSQGQGSGTYYNVFRNSLSPHTASIVLLRKP